MTGDFGQLEINGCWWSTTEYFWEDNGPIDAWFYRMDMDAALVFYPESKSCGLSVRCLKDN
jgi:hypothetical protein